MLRGALEDASLRVISLGAGVQSTALALMAAHGEIGPMPDCAIFADTQWEPQIIYDHLNWLEKELPFPVYRVSTGDIRQMVLDSTNGVKTTNNKGLKINASLPFHVEGAEEKKLSASMLLRQCTNRFKIQPINQEMRRLLGVGKGKRVPQGVMVEKWIGISLDEVHRAKDSRDKWQEHRFPLLERRLSRYDCQLWFEKHYPDRKLQKSACIGCPYHDNRRWREMKEKDPLSWQDAIEFDTALRQGTQNPFGVRTSAYVHGQLVPLGDVDLATEQNRGQMDMFGEECEGMCGV